jgi:cellulose synthase/poly-beta-1,6-N-acetylglucosamine synthase-like glycosyltransferase
MAQIILPAIFWFFAIFGMIHMTKLVASTLFDAFDLKKEVVIVIKVCNQQDNIEGVIRSVVWRSLKGANPLNIPTILVVDMDSTDETPIILKKLSRRYKFIKVASRQEYIEQFTIDN